MVLGNPYCNRTLSIANKIQAYIPGFAIPAPM